MHPCLWRQMKAISGSNIQQNYSSLSREEFVTDLRCFENNYTQTIESYATVDSFVNSGAHSVFCLFGFIFALIWSILYLIIQFRLDLPTVLVRRALKNTNRELYHLIFLTCMLPSLLFCFFYTWALEYQIQMTPCLGLDNKAYPKFTSV